VAARRTGEAAVTGPPGDIGQEARALVEAARERVARTFPDSHAPECQWCPVCRTVAALRDPDVADRVAGAVTAAAGTLASLLDSLTRSAPGPARSPSRPGSGPASGAAPGPASGAASGPASGAAEPPSAAVQEIPLDEGP
jgi:hypothetical protein